MYITKMDVAKEAASLTASIVCAMGFATVISRTTSMDEDDIPVRVASSLGGWYVANRYRENTDLMVEQAAAKLSNMRESFRTKKQAQA